MENYKKKYQELKEQNESESSFQATMVLIFVVAIFILAAILA